MEKSNRTFLTYLFFFSCLVSTTQLYSQSDTTISVDRILEKYIAALGGKDVILKLTSRVRKGVVEIPGINGLGTVERYQKAPNKLMSIQQIPGYGVIQTIFDGTTGWYQRPEIPIQQPEGSWLADLKNQADFYWPLRLKQIFSSMLFEGIEKIDNFDTYVVKAIPHEGSTEKLYFDSRSGLLIRQDIIPRGGVDTVTIRLEDYREEDGVKLPFVIRETNLIVKYTAVKHNAQIDDSIFEKKISK